MTKPNDCYAYFSLIGEFEPDEITRMAGCGPTRSWKAGDPGRYNPKLPSSGWTLDSALPRTDAIEAHIEDVLDQMDQFEAGFLAVTGRHAATMQLVGYFHEHYPGLHFTAPIVQRLSRYRLSVDCDFYNYYCERGPRPAGKGLFRIRRRPAG